MRTRIKMCGMTSHEDAMYASQLGVDAIGLIFYEQSPRFVSIEKALEIVNGLPPFLSKVGVFVNENPKKVAKILEHVSLDVLQFHGTEPAQLCRSFGRPYIKAIHVDETGVKSGYEQVYPDASAFLFDTFMPGTPGGSGRVFQWQHLPKKNEKPIILAGGLTPENVSEAIAIVQPYAVDVTSGIEIKKGVKDRAKMAAFVANVT